MSHFSIIQRKLEQFIKKYYINELIKGGILFFATGLLYLIVTLLIEHFLWLEPTGRAILFWVFVGVEMGLFLKFIAMPLARLFHLQKGITEEQASKIIGNHFPQVSDKLLNVIQLNQNQRQSELLAASIDQKASELQPIPFKRAINFRRNAKYLKYAAIPVAIVLLVSLVWDKSLFTNSYERVVHYDTAYEPPAPFTFRVLNESLQAIENKRFTLKVVTDGDVLPESASIEYLGQTYYLDQTAPGYFEYVFDQPVESFDFQIKSNKVTSQTYSLEVLKTPTLLEFEMALDYPSYTGRSDEVLKSTGNATLPEGTQIQWRVKAQNTEEVLLKTTDTVLRFTEHGNNFKLNRRIFKRLEYALTTSNEFLKEYENLSFDINVIKDAYPDIKVQSKPDSTALQTLFFLGQVSDDYGLSKLRLVYFPVGQPEHVIYENIPIGNSNVDQFTYVFPGNLTLEEGVSYEYYFEVFDNDGIHGSKSSKSNVFSFRKLTKDEEETLQLNKQQESIQDLSKQLDGMKDQEKRLDDITKTQREKENLNWNDKKKLEEFLKRQKQQDELMQKFSKEMKEDLEKFQPNEESDPMKEQLQERFQENEKQLEENEKLLEELEKLQDKIEKEELMERLDKLSKQNKNQERNLEQLVELTKRYYVAKKAEKLADELFKLGEKQEQLADKPSEENSKEAQEKLNKEFDELQKEMEELQKENEGLKQPMDIPLDSEGEKEVEQEQKEATEKLQQQNKQGAKQNQKKAGQKMKQMGKQMQAQMAAGQMETLDEDIDMLRQILDNLVTFSFEQEDLMVDFKGIDYGSAAFGKKLNVQNDLKRNFEHIDDSLFSLSLRQPMISKTINEALINVTYNLDKSLENLAENNVRNGVANQQYTVTGANELAVLLSELLNNMQSMSMEMPGQGQGQGEGKGQGFQLPDIIKQQESLNQKMEQGVQPGEKPGQEGQQQGQGQQGEGEGESEQGQQGSQGKNGENGEGNNGSQDEKEGENGQQYREEMNGKLFEIYKQQQDLRNQLKDRLSKEGLEGLGGKLLKEMEGIEQRLLEHGFNDETLKRMLDLQHELLKLDEADFEQGKEEKRESRTNRQEYENQLRLQPEEIKKYFNQIEILNREALPLQQEYRKEVQRYFDGSND